MLPIPPLLSPWGLGDTVTADTRLLPSSLYRYKHPSDEELCALAGKQRPKTKRDRSAAGWTGLKP